MAFMEHPLIHIYNTNGENRVKSIVNNVNIPHIKVAPNHWNGLSVINITDYAITCNGSIGFEFAAQGKPVLIADNGLYDNFNFGAIAKSQVDYKNKLNSSWWKEINTRDSKLNALKFIGYNFCLPYWQGNLIYEDDSKGDLIYYNIDKFLDKNEKSLKDEIYCIRDWYESESDLYNI